MDKEAKFPSCHSVIKGGNNLHYLITSAKSLAFIFRYMS